MEGVSSGSFRDGDFGSNSRYILQGIVLCEPTCEVSERLLCQVM